MLCEAMSLRVHASTACQDAIAKFEAALSSKRGNHSGSGHINRRAPPDKSRFAQESDATSRRGARDIIGIFEINCLVTSVSRKAHKMPVERRRVSNINYAFLETLALCCPSACARTDACVRRDAMLIPFICRK